MLLMGAQTAVNAQELTVSDVQNSGCLSEVKPSMDGRKRTNDDYEEPEYGETQTIVLTKEGSSLKVQLFNVESNCCTLGFDVKSSMKEGNETTPCTVSANVYSTGELDCDCICPYNISFTINGIEANSFKFSCWWYNGLVNLTEGEPLVLEDIEENINIDGIVYTIHKTMCTAKLIDGKTWVGELNIPSELDYEGQKYPVLSIDYNAFRGNTTLTSVNIPNSVTKIGGSAFNGCSSLISAVIPESITNIEGGVFYKCSSLTSVNIPESVRSIGGSAFNGCSSLADITISNSVTSIGDGAFDGTAWFNNQPDGVVYAGKFAYKYKGTMPEGTHVIIKEGTTQIACNAFHGCTGMASITIPESMTSIGESAFDGCNSLTSVTIPEGMTRINKYTFRNCGSLKSIVIPQNVTSIGTGAFQDCKSLTFVTIPEGVKEIEYSTFGNCSSLTSINIPEGVTSIGGYSFEGCTSLTSIVIPESVKEIGNGAFQGCSSLTSVNIPKGVTNIYSFTFSGCTGLASITIPENVKFIDSYAFGYCTGLTLVTIPESVEYIGGYAFRDCDNLKDIYCYADNIPIGRYAFDDCPIASATLHVPAGSIEKYKTTSPWSGFGNIVALIDPVTFTQGQIATIILPTDPDASKGKYYRLDRWEDNQIVFEQELQPQARVPYIIVPDEDFSVDPSTMDLTGLSSDTVTVGDISFIGSYISKELPALTGGDMGGSSFYYEIIDSTPDCQRDEAFTIGALRAYLTIRWDDPINPGGERSPQEKMRIVLKDYGTNISLTPDPSRNGGEVYDLSGRRISAKPQRGVYIEDGRKVVK